MDILKIKNLNVSYGKNHVIKNFTINIPDVVEHGETRGQLVAILGESGCGKSTLFRAISGLKDYKGEIQIIANPDSSPEEWTYKAPRAGDIGLVDQKYTMFRAKTVFQSLMYSMKSNKDITTTEKENRILGYLEQMNIIDIKDKYPNEISGGQRQRSAILERLLNGNRYIILDEPLSGLDVKNKEAAKKFMRNLVNQHEANTILFCTHVIQVAVELADIIIVLSKEGRILHSVNLREKGYTYNAYDNMHYELNKELKSIIINN